MCELKVFLLKGEAREKIMDGAGEDHRPGWQRAFGRDLRGVDESGGEGARVDIMAQSAEVVAN